MRGQVLKYYTEYITVNVVVFSQPLEGKLNSSGVIDNFRE